MAPSVDLFCRVVDNYGDIGVCWRLARRLAHGLNWRVRLWVDDLGSFARIAPGLDATAPSQVFEGIDVRLWPDTDRSGAQVHLGSLCGQAGVDVESTRAHTVVPLIKPFAAPFTAHDIVIEAFACELPDAFISAMRDASPPPLWINLEYLSAERWVEDCHGLASLRPDGLKKTFFFPGFTPATGGLLREPDVLPARIATQRDHQSKVAALRAAGLTALADALHEPSTQLVNLFCYPHAPLREALDALSDAQTSTHTRSVVVCAATGVAPSLEAVAEDYPNVSVVRIPFLAQSDFDRLLWCGDLNIVRGEDSFVRAIWAGRPTLWHIYPQDDDAHLVKLDAWLDLYDVPASAKRAIRVFNEQTVVATDPPSAANTARSDCGLSAALSESLMPPVWQAWQTDARQWTDTLAQQPDLAENLAAFWTNTAKKS